MKGNAAESQYETEFGNSVENALEGRVRPS